MLSGTRAINPTPGVRHVGTDGRIPRHRCRHSGAVGCRNVVGLSTGRDVIRRLRAELSPEALLTFTRWVCVRARLPEDIVETAAADGVEQYVILGASHPRLLPWAKRRSLRGSPAPDHGHGGREAHLGVGSEVARPAHAVTLSP